MNEHAVWDATMEPLREHFEDPGEEGNSMKLYSFSAYVQQATRSTGSSNGD